MPHGVMLFVTLAVQALEQLFACHQLTLAIACQTSARNHQLVNH